MSNGPSHVTRSLSGISRNVAKHSGLKAKISVQKIYACWEDIIGKDFADKCIPVHISWSKYNSHKKPSILSSMPSLSPTVKNAPQETNNRKQADKKTSQATLQIAASSAIATRLMYQEHLIVERLHRILGYDVIKGISVKHESGLDNRSYGHALPRKLDKAERAYLNSALENVEDAAVKKLLESLGEKILLDHRR